ncbi:MAG: metal ABC transporter permease [Chitinivibrionales bacterium]|nr:metal ABC transporter permease [Chitinivibrionales bacterium]
MTHITSFIGILPFEWAHYAFMQNALLAVLIVTPLFAFLGCMVVNNQMAFFSDAIGHAGLTGIALGALLGMAETPLWSMLVFAVLMAVGITVLRRYSAASSDTVIGIVMSFTVACGVVILSRGGGFNKYSRYLIGDLLSITRGEILSLILVAALFLVFWLSSFNRIFLVSTNTSLARSRRVNIWFTQGLFACITALVVTMSIQWVGILVINALIILPAAAARNLARSMAAYLWMAAGMSVIAGVSGLITSYYWSSATGATIVIFGMVFYVGSLVAGRVRGR